MTISKIPITVVEFNLLKFKLQLGAVSNERTWFKALIFKTPFRNNNLTRTKTKPDKRKVKVLDRKYELCAR